jgi:hypothetical protein
LPNRTVTWTAGGTTHTVNPREACEPDRSVRALAAGKMFQVNDMGYVVYVPVGFSWRDGITRNLWQTSLASAGSPWNVPLSFGHAIIDRPLRDEAGAGVGISQILGNVMPDFRATVSNNFQYKRVNAYALFDGTFGHRIYNMGEQWGLFDWASDNFDMRKRTVEEAKPIGYHWRVGPPENSAGTGGFYDILGVNNYNFEDGSYVKLREANLSYHIGPVRGVGDWTVGLVGRNLLTFTKYSGYDPEIGGNHTNTGANSGLISQVDAFDFPTLRNYTISLSTRF